VIQIPKKEAGRPGFQKSSSSYRWLVLIFWMGIYRVVLAKDGWLSQPGVAAIQIVSRGLEGIQKF
jgi:hypothetical protein